MEDKNNRQAASGTSPANTGRTVIFQSSFRSTNRSVLYVQRML